MQIECKSYDLTVVRKFCADKQISDVEKLEALEPLKEYLDERIDLLRCELGKNY